MLATMPQVSAEIWVPVSPEAAFAVSQTTGATRKRWDTFITEQHFLDGAAAPGKGVRTFTKSRVGPSMISEYVSYRPPTSVGMTMVKGPWFFARFGGGWRFMPADHAAGAAADHAADHNADDAAADQAAVPPADAADDSAAAGTRAVWKYTYSIRPAWLRRPGEWMGQIILGREIRARIEAFAAACRDEEILRGLPR